MGLSVQKAENFGTATTRDEIAGGVEERSFNVSNLSFWNGKK